MTRNHQSQAQEDWNTGAGWSGHRFCSRIFRKGLSWGVCVSLPCRPSLLSVFINTLERTSIKTSISSQFIIKFIILAKPDDEKNTKLNFMCLDKTKTIPVFTDSYEVDNFIIECLDNNYTDIKKYSPMCLNFKELYYFYYLNYSDFKIVIDPCAQQIKDINFSFVLSNKLIKYIYSIRK